MPNGPGTRASQAATAIRLAYLEGLTQEQIAERLDINQSTVSRYLNDEPSEKVKESLYQQATHTRLLSWAELVKQLRAATDRAENAMTLTKVYGETDEDIEIAEKKDENGNVIDRVAVPKRYTYKPDHEARADARREVCEILTQMRTITGTDETRIEISSDEQTGVDITTSVYADDDTEE